MKNHFNIKNSSKFAMVNKLFIVKSCFHSFYRYTAHLAILRCQTTLKMEILKYGGSENESSNLYTSGLFFFIKQKFKIISGPPILLSRVQSKVIYQKLFLQALYRASRQTCASIVIHSPGHN